MEKTSTTTGKVGEIGGVIHTHSFSCTALHNSYGVFSTLYTLEGPDIGLYIGLGIQFSTYQHP